MVPPPNKSSKCLIGWAYNLVGHWQPDPVGAALRLLLALQCVAGCRKPIDAAENSPTQACISPDSLGGRVSAINPPLNDEERRLMFLFATWVIADQSDSDAETAAEALDTLAGEGEVVLRGDAEDVYFEACGSLILHAKREVLAFYAADNGL